MSGNTEAERLSIKEIVGRLQRDVAAKKLLNTISPTIDDLKIKAMKGSSMVYDVAKAVILDREKPVPGTNIFDLQVEYLIIMEDTHDQHQVNIYVREAGGVDSTVYFANKDWGKFQLASISQRGKEGEMVLRDQVNFLQNVVTAARSGLAQQTIINH